MFVICAHDPTLIEVIDIFPKMANDWKFKGWKEAVRWKFLADWEKAEVTVIKRIAQTGTTADVCNGRRGMSNPCELNDLF